MKLYFLAFPSHPQSIFSLDADAQYGIHSIIKAVNDERFIKKHHSATLANSDWCIEFRCSAGGAGETCMWRCIWFASESPVCAFKRPHGARSWLKGEITGEIR